MAALRSARLATFPIANPRALEPTE